MAPLWQGAPVGSHEPPTTEKTMKRILFALALVPMVFAMAPPNSAFAADAKGQFAIDGIGAAPCSALLKAREGDNRSLFLAVGGWIGGYITAVNALTDDTFDLTPWEKTDLFMALLESNCEQNPDLQVVVIVRGLVQSLFAERLRSSTESKQIDLGEGRKVAHYVDTLRRIQKALKDQGHYTGTIDGDYGPGTRTAMAAFQKSAELEPTGLPDQLTLLRLLHPGGPGGKQ
jgi:hypothetical protein